MNKHICLLIQWLSVSLIVLSAIALIVGKDFESAMGRNTLDFIAIVAFGLVGRERFHRVRKEEQEG